MSRQRFSRFLCNPVGVLWKARRIGGDLVPGVVRGSLVAQAEPLRRTIEPLTVVRLRVSLGLMKRFAVTVSELRQNIYQLLDQVLESGVPLEIERKGRKLRIAPEPPRDKLDNLKRRDCLIGDPEAIVHMDWSQEWRP